MAEFLDEDLIKSSARIMSSFNSIQGEQKYFCDNNGTDYRQDRFYKTFRFQVSANAPAYRRFVDCPFGQTLMAPLASNKDLNTRSHATFLHL